MNEETEVIRPTYILFVIAALLITGAYPFLDLVPSWDAGWYLGCLLSAVEADFHLKNFNCVGHTSFAYILILSIGQYFSYANIALIHLTNLLLWIFSTIAFYFISIKIFARNASRSELALFSGVLAFLPSCTAQIFHPNLDYGVLVFFILCIAFLLHRRIIPAILCGTIMSFTKEIGAALYLCTWIAYLASIEFDFEKRFNKEFFYRAIVLSVPVLLFILRTAYRYYRFPDQNLFYTEAGYSFGEKSFAEMFFDFNVFEKTFRAYLADIFLLNFQWIMSAIILMGAIASLFLSPIRKRVLELLSREMVFLLILFLCALFVSTRHRPFNHLRYIITLYPFLVILFGFSLYSLILSARLRISLCICIIGLSIVSSYRTIDPVSKGFYGTFPFGKHDLLDMASDFFVPNNVRASFNRDELVYNLEYLKLHQIFDLIFEDLKIDPHLTLLGSQDSRFFWPGMVDTETLHRTVHRSGVFKPHYFDYVEEFSDVVEKPKTLYYFEFPSMLSPRQFKLLEKWYRYTGTEIYDLDGYQIRVHVFEKNDSDSGSSGSSASTGGGSSRG